MGEMFVFSLFTKNSDIKKFHQKQHPDVKLLWAESKQNLAKGQLESHNVHHTTVIPVMNPLHVLLSLYRKSFLSYVQEGLEKWAHLLVEFILFSSDAECIL